MAEAALMLDVSRGTVLNYVRRGWLTRYRVKPSGRFVFKRAELEEFMNGDPELELDADNQPSDD